MSSVLTENIVLSRTRSHDLRNVKKLNCWGSELSDISIVRRMPNVEVLSLSLNNIASLQDFSLCKYLQELYLRKNKISDINEIYYLQDLPNLKKLSLEDNPCNQHANYRYTIIKALPRLETLDNTNVTSEEVTKAQTLGDDIYDPSSEQPSYPPLNGHSHQKLTIQQQHQQLPDDEDYETYDEDLELSREVSYTEIYREKDEGTYAYIPESKPLSLTPQNGSNPSIPVENIRNKIQQSPPQPQPQPQPQPAPPPTNQQQIQQQPQPPPPPQQQLQGNGLQNQITPQQVSQQHVLPQAQLQQRYSLQEISPDTWNSKESKQVTSNLSSSASSTMLRSQSVSDYNMYNGSICNNSTANCRSNDTKSCISDQTNDLYQFHNENGSGTERYSPLSSHGGNGGTGSCGSSGGSGNGIGTGRRYGYQSIQSISSQQKPLSKGGRNRNGNILSAVLCLIKELDYASLEVVETAIHCRMEEMED